MRVTERPSEPLQGEDIGTLRWEDARHWIGVYADLLRFKVGLLDRIRRDLAKLRPVARLAAEVDLRIIEGQMEGYQKRLELWYRRVWDLHGVWLDPQERMIRYQGREAGLTKQEFQLLQFLVDHPHRYFSAADISGRAWAEPHLLAEEVRNYVHRIRKVLAELEIPCDLVIRPGRGYSIEFRDH